MTLSGKRLKKPITVAEIGSCIGSSSKDVGTLVLHSNVNMWSRKKPVHISSPEPNRSLEWWKGTENNCGINPPARVSTFAAVKALYDGGLNGWSYTKPATYYRMLDFDGYYHDATPQINGLKAPPTILSGNDISVSVGIRESDLDSSGSGSLDMSEITVDGVSLNNWYIGIALFENDTRHIGHIATNRGLQAQEYTYPTNDSMIGKSYTIVPFYSKVMLSKDSGNATEGALMPLPNLMPQRVTVISRSTRLYVGIDEPLWDSARTTISFTVIATSNSTDIVKISSAIIKLRFIEHGYEDGMEGGEYQFDMGAFDVPAGQEVVKSYSQVIGSSYRSKDYIVYVKLMSSNGTEYTAQEEVLDNTELS